MTNSRKRAETIRKRSQRGQRSDESDAARQRRELEEMSELLQRLIDDVEEFVLHKVGRVTRPMCYTPHVLACQRVTGNVCHVFSARWAEARARQQIH
jgi:hypothetical protein